MAGGGSLITNIYIEIMSQKGGEGKKSETKTVTLNMEFHMCCLFDVTINRTLSSIAELTEAYNE